MPIPTWLHVFGGVGETSPGQTRSVVVDLKAGKYAWFSGTAPEREGAQPQYRRGAEGSFEVAGDSSGARLPATAAQVTAKELGPTNYRFEATGFSEITAVVDRGGRQVETVELKPGSYALLCFLTDRAGGPPHVLKAKMIQEVKVA